MSVCELLRKGAANAESLDNLSCTFLPVGFTTPVRITKLDLKIALKALSKNASVRLLAESMAPTILDLSIQQYTRNSSQDLRGDLTNKINKRLLNRNQNSLTPLERIACNTFMQWMGNLDEKTQSTRLKALLEEDLSLSRERKTKQNEKDAKKTHNIAYSI
jgi:hypothetical protein